MKTRPISEAPRDGRTLMLMDDTGWRAVGYWSDGMWAEGHKEECRTPVEIEFEPTHFEDPNQ